MEAIPCWWSAGRATECRPAATSLPERGGGPGGLTEHVRAKPAAPDLSAARRGSLAELSGERGNDRAACSAVFQSNLVTSQTFNHEAPVCGARESNPRYAAGARVAGHAPPIPIGPCAPLGDLQQQHGR